MIVVGVSPLTKEIVLPDLDTLVPPPVTTQLARLTPSGPVTVIDAPGSSSPATVSFLEISTTVGASSIVTTAFPLAVAAVTELPVIVPSVPTVNSMSVATWNPSGAATSCIVYVPAGSPWMVVAEFPLVKLITSRFILILDPPPVTVQLVRSRPSLEVTVICAPGSSLPATVSFLEMSTVPVTSGTTRISSSIVTIALEEDVAAVI